MIDFLTIAVGQTIGAPLFGFLMSRTSLETAVLAFSGIGLAAGLFWSESPPNQVTTADIGYDPLPECSTHQ
ncbi:hypothetical protein [Salinisphaera orenii]|uniref:hypothetical protein n=1 Tax=Salinisphaera orenii TaxID=856731 RepID=UPI000DBEA043